MVKKKAISKKVEEKQEKKSPVIKKEIVKEPPHKIHHKIKHHKNHSAAKKEAPKLSYTSVKVVKNASNAKNSPTLNISRDLDIAMDFATKVYERFNKVIKSIVLFGSTAKQTTVPGSDIDIIMIIDDVAISWDQELISWYREELDKLVKKNPYKRDIHVNTIKLSTWWDDLMRGDPMIINVIRYGESLIDFGGFFEPLKFLLIKGKIRSTPEAVYSCLERAPQHFLRSKAAQLNSIEGLYWAMVDSLMLPLYQEMFFLHLQSIYL